MTEPREPSDARHAAARAALDAVVIRRDALYTAILGLERAMAAASGDDPAGWAARAETAALALRATWRRHVADTGLQIQGDAAARWMVLAQCFAGPPADGPAPGVRLVRLDP